MLVFCFSYFLGYSTVPRSIVQQFGLTGYDMLEWILKAEGRELVIQVKPKKGEVR
jgi:hypothetical protein